jgi:predicted dinucleotide-binding enzyme
MKLAIIGAGSVGGTLGTAWAQKAGHEIFFGVRNPQSEKVQALVRSLGGKARAGTAADAAAKPKVIALLAALGFEVIDAGPLRNARLLEAHAMLWIELALKRGLGRDFAFAILRR